LPPGPDPPWGGHLRKALSIDNRGAVGHNGFMVNWNLALQVVSQIPWERILFRDNDKAIERLEQRLQNVPSVYCPAPSPAPAPDPSPALPATRELPAPNPTPAPTPAPAPARQTELRGLTTDQTVHYQRRELAKELILLEGHLQQGCKIGGRACDCCEKHPLKIEGLAQETAGMSTDPIYEELAGWISNIAPMTSWEASASGRYDDEYPRLAMKAREFRKAIMPADMLQTTPHKEAGEEG